MRRPDSPSPPRPADPIDRSTDVRFPAGVIEGFYGRPWSQEARLQLFEWMGAWGLNTYFYAPKDDLHHRALWREPYPAEAEARLRALTGACRERDIAFVYGIGPGLDIDYGSDAELLRLQARLEQLMRAGCGHFALLFDDIPASPDGAGIRRFGSLAAAQSHVANALCRWLRQQLPRARFMFCPTPYCGRMAAAQLGGAGYLETIGGALDDGIDILWTGPDIISRDIPVAHVRDVRAVLRRKPVIWDNLQANDYDGNRFFCGPCSGRPPELLREINGLLSNPNVEFPLNYVPLRTLGWFVDGDPRDPRAAYLAAMAEWRASFATVHGDADLEDVILFGDCFYLPHEEGAEAEALVRSATRLVREGGSPEAARVFRRRAARLRAFCAGLSDLRDRALFHALNRPAWALREEIDLLERVEGGPERIASDFHLPGTYRGGIVARLQALLVPQPDGSFIPADADPPTPAVHGATGAPARHD